MPGFNMIQQWEYGNLVNAHCDRANLVCFVDLHVRALINAWLLPAKSDDPVAFEGIVA